tara:strand:- start:285 stop:530 length:246 start_codon:yes stop_codon:yes gene_type:complete
MSKEVPENIELKNLVVIGKVNHKIIRMIISNMRNILSGEATGALGLELKLSEVMMMIGLTIMIMKMINLRKDKFINLKNLD